MIRSHDPPVASVVAAGFELWTWERYA